MTSINQEAPPIKAIETHYKGYRFRSRLEARWAVFFDALEIEWEYEPEGFVLPDGTYYLPDFWLPTYGGGMFVEVKPAGGDFSKAEMLARGSGKKVLLLEGAPDQKAYGLVEWRLPSIFDAEPDDHHRLCFEAAWLWGYEDRPYYGWGEFEIGDDMSDAWSGSLCERAVQAARSSRFEHGERP